MSSRSNHVGRIDGKGLCNLDYIDRYQEVLTEHLPDNFTQFGEFFSGTKRLRTCAVMLKRHLNSEGLKVLNVGSGPFATEVFVEPLQAQQIHSVDYTPEFAPFLRHFQREGLIANTTFQQADAMSVEFEHLSFDLIILHDLLYENALDMASLILHLRRFLKPGGLVFFDFVNRRTEWIWRLLGKPGRFRRYDPAEVRKFLSENDFELVEIKPTHGARSLSVRVLHGFLWMVFRASNNYAVLARKGKCHDEKG